MQSYSPPIPTSIMATSTFCCMKIANAMMVKKPKYWGMSFSWVCKISVVVKLEQSTVNVGKASINKKKKKPIT